jgi:hypothetical protein
MMQPRSLQEILDETPEQAADKIFCQMLGPVVGKQISLEIRTLPKYSCQWQVWVNNHIAHQQKMKKMYEESARLQAARTASSVGAIGSAISVIIVGLLYPAFCLRVIDIRELSPKAAFVYLAIGAALAIVSAIISFYLCRKVWKFWMSRTA